MAWPLAVHDLEWPGHYWPLATGCRKFRLDCYLKMAGALAVWSINLAVTAASSPPNIIFFVVDDLGWYVHITVLEYCTNGGLNDSFCVRHAGTIWDTSVTRFQDNTMPSSLHILMIWPWAGYVFMTMQVYATKHNILNEKNNVCEQLTTVTKTCNFMELINSEVRSSPQS